jgi:RNA polymerase sigma-70 factor (ECF subfamily)
MRSRIDFDELYRAHFGFVWRMLRRQGVPIPQLEDAAQEVFIVVHRNLERWDPDMPRSWLFGIARRVASDVRRSRDRADRKLRAVALVGERTTADPSGRVDAAEFVARVLAQMDEEKRMVFTLIDIEGLSATEAADALGANVNTVYSRLRAARAQFHAAREQGHAGGPGLTLVRSRG